MSILFYRRPDYLNKSPDPINPRECTRYIERAKNSERAIPSGLAFEDIMSNKSLPPCSLNDFMDYLVYVEYNAENLQFYLWYKDYAQRFETLPESDKALSPKWPSKANAPTLAKDPEKTENVKMKRETFDLSEAGYDSVGAVAFSDDKQATIAARHGSVVSGSIATPSVTESTAISSSEAATQASLKWQPFTIQPMRDEVNRIMHHYITSGAPRELNLSHKDRALCLHAIQHTTHPSALLPALNIVEATLRGQSHPNFIRWSICNGNKPRVFFVRTMGVTNIAFGFLIAVLLTLSRASRWWRVFAAIEWYMGISTMVAAYKGLCVIMHHSHARNLRPWEQGLDAEVGDVRRESFSSTANRSIQLASRTSKHEYFDGDNSTLRPESMQTFGPKNSFDTASWVEKYQKKPLLRKVFDQTTWTQDETLRILQDKIVLGANLWAIIFTIPMTIIFVALPNGNLF